VKNRKNFLTVELDLPSMSNLNKLRHLQGYTETPLPEFIEPTVDFIESNLDISRELANIVAEFTNLGQYNKVYFPKEGTRIVKAFNVETGEKCVIEH
jgi:hypothetical protein